jgi:hypothetical protein
MKTAKSACFGRGWLGGPVPKPVVKESPWSKPDHRWYIAEWKIRVAWDDIEAFAWRAVEKLRIAKDALASVRVRVAGEWVSLSPFLHVRMALYSVRAARARLDEKSECGGVNYPEREIEAVEIIFQRAD